MISKEQEAERLLQHAIKTPAWIPSGWDVAATDLLSEGNAKFRPEAERLFTRGDARAMTFWQAADEAFAVRPLSSRALPLDWFRRRTLAELWFKGGRIPDQSVSQIKSQRQKICIALKRFIAAVNAESEVSRLKISDLLAFQVNPICDVNGPKDFGALSHLLKESSTARMQFVMLSPTLPDVLQALEKRMAQKLPLSIFDPLKHRNQLAPVRRAKSDSAETVLFARSMTDHFVVSTGVPQNGLVATALEMAFDLPSETISDRVIANRLRGSAPGRIRSKKS